MAKQHGAGRTARQPVGTGAVFDDDQTGERRVDIKDLDKGVESSSPERESATMGSVRLQREIMMKFVC